MIEIKRNIDFVFCIDGSKSMEVLKKSIVEKLAELVDATANRISEARELGNIRGKLILFRDYAIDKNPMEVSPWFDIKRGLKELKTRLEEIDYTGGESSQRNGLEALYLASRSDFHWESSDRQIIVLISDADAILKCEHKDHPDYPKGMDDAYDLINILQGCNEDPSLKYRPRIGTIIGFAPSSSVYKTLCELLMSPFYPLEPSKGVEADMDFLAKFIHAGNFGIMRPDSK